MTDQEIQATYDLISEYHTKYLEEHGVLLPKLKRGEQYTKDALVLVFLARNYPATSVVTKEELTDFIRQYYPEVNDVQQARHLAAQKGWMILSGTRHDQASKALAASEYQLTTLKKHYPGFTHQRRACAVDGDEFEELKRAYDYRCACCGSREGEPHRYWTNTITVLQKGHMDPSKPLEPGNIIPQCQKCNQPDRNYWIYDAKGRVVGIANPRVIDRCTEQVQHDIYTILKQKFEDQ